MTDTTQNQVVDLAEAPRGVTIRVWEWARANLFNSPLNTVLTLAITYLFLRVLWPFIRWATIDSTWNAANDRACQASGGACWAFLREWGRFILFGRYPYEQQWRPALVLALFVVMLLVTARRSTGGRALLMMWSGGLVLVFALMWGGFLGMPYVETDLWNGLPLNLILALGGVGFSFPVAILVALGRRSRMPAIRWLSVAYIELIRGVPLITVLFMSALMVPLFLPGGASIAKLWRAEVALTLFFGAYLAEAIRAGLQVIPRGQYEAADSLGLGYWRKMGLIILPQALAISIPAIVNTAIGAFKDTTLITIVGIFDVLQDVNNATNDPGWRNAYWEGYVFVGAIFFVFCLYLSRYSQSLERSLSRARPGARRT